MKVRDWWQDTIARRFIVTQLLAVGLTLALLALFSAFGGFWVPGTLGQIGAL